MRESGFPNPLHWALYAQDFAVESMRPIHGDFGSRLTQDPELTVQMAHDTVLTLSPWFALSKWIWHLRKPALDWPQLHSLTLTPGAYVFRRQLWEMECKLHACIVLPCPECDKKHSLSFMSTQDGIYSALCRLACPYTSMPLWPWLQPADAEYAPVANVLQFPTPTKKDNEHAPKDPEPSSL